MDHVFIVPAPWHGRHHHVLQIPRQPPRKRGLARNRYEWRRGAADGRTSWHTYKKINVFHC